MTRQLSMKTIGIADLSMFSLLDLRKLTQLACCVSQLELRYLNNVVVNKFRLKIQ